MTISRRKCKLANHDFKNVDLRKYKDVIINTIKTKTQLFNLLKLFAVSALFVCLYGIAQYIFGWNVKQAWMDEEMFEEDEEE